MAGHRGEVFTVDAEAFVGLRERAAVVPSWATQHLRHQKHLVSLESSYVDPFEVRCKLRVGENPHIEVVVYDSAHGRAPANGVVIADRSASRLVTHFVIDPSETRTVAEKLHTTYRPAMESVERSIPPSEWVENGCWPP